MTKLILRSLSFEKTEAVKYRRAGGTDSELLSPRLFFALFEHDAHCEHCEAGGSGAVDTYADR